MFLMELEAKLKKKKSGNEYDYEKDYMKIKLIQMMIYY